MKPKISRGGGFRGIAKYALGKGKGAEFVAGNVAGTTPRTLSSEFAVSRQLRPDVTRPVWHTSLALPEGERLADDQWRAVIDDYMDGMGFDRDNHQFFAVRHKDTNHDHVHVIASRIGLDGSVWHGKWEARKAIDLVQVLEERHGLIRTQGYYKKEEKGLTSGETQMGKLIDGDPPKKRLQDLIKRAVENNPTAAQFAEKLVMSGVEVRANISSTGKLSGFSFGLDGHSFKGSQLGPKFSWANKKYGLQKQGVSYDEDRDREQLEHFSGARPSKPTDTDNLRIADEAEHNQQPVESVREPDGRPVEPEFIPADGTYAGTDQPVPGDDGRSAFGHVVDGSDGHQEPDFSSTPTVEREIGRGAGRDPGRGFESVRPADWGAFETSSRDQRSDGETVGRGAESLGATGKSAEKRKRRLEAIDQKHRSSIDRLEEGRESSGEGKPKNQGTERPSRKAMVESSNSVDVGRAVDKLGILVDRHVITPEKARQAIDKHIAEKPAPSRPEGRKVPTGPLSRWLAATKTKLAKFIQKARDYFNDKATESAMKGGWNPDEIRGSGFEGDVLDRSEAAQTARLLEQAERMKRITAVQATKKPLSGSSPTTPPEEPDIDLFDDDDDPDLGPGLR